MNAASHASATAAQATPIASACPASGALERHLRLLRKRHVRRRDTMIQAVAAHLPQARVHGAAAGLHLTLTFEAALSDVDLAAAALARGVKVHPLSWHRQRPGPPGLVLGYAASPPTEICDGIAIVGSILDHRRPGAGVRRRGLQATASDATR